MTAESLAPFRQPELIPGLPDLITDLLTRLRRIAIHPDMGNSDKVIAFLDTLDDLAPPPPTRDPQAAVSKIRGRGAAGLEELLSTWTGPASELFAWITATGDTPAKIHTDVTHSVVKTLSAAQCAGFRAVPGTPYEERDGWMYAGEDRDGAAVKIHSEVILDRLPPGAVTSLHGDVPLGLILGRLCRREPAGNAVPYWGGVSSTAWLWYRDKRVA